MSETYKLKFTRWALRGVSETTTCTAMEAMTTQAYERMVSSEWTKLSGLSSNLPPHKYRQSGFLDTYDACKFCGDYDDDTAMQKAYAGAVCYTVTIPGDALAGTKARIESVAATLFGDRWTSCGAVLSAILSSSPTPPSWADVLATTYSSPDPVVEVDDADPTWQAPLRKVVRSNTSATGDPLKPDTSCDAVIAVGVDATAYLHVVLRLGDYIPTYLAWVEGGAMLLGSTLAVTFDRAVSDVPPPPDAQLVDSDHDGWSDIAEYYAGTHPGDSRDAPATTINLVCDYPGNIAGGQIVVHAYSNAAMIGRPDAVYHIPMSAWTVEGTTRFLASLETSAPVEGRLREGDVWFFAFIDTGSTGVYNVAMPACVATYGRTSISWGHNIVRFIFSDDAFGYARLQWATTPKTGILVTITRPGDPTAVTCFEKRIFGRNYIHEGDFLFLPETSEYAGVRAGLPMYDYEATYTATIGEDTQTFTHLWFESATPRVNAYVNAEANDVEVRGRDMYVRWIGDIRSCGFAIRVERFVGNVWQDVLIRYAYAAQAYATSGLIGQFELVVNYDSHGSRIDFEDGTYRASVCNLVNQTGVAPTTISGVVGGGGAKGSSTWSSSFSGSGNPPGKGRASSFGTHVAPGGGGGCCITLGISDSVPIGAEIAANVTGANGGGGAGVIAARYSASSLGHISGEAGGGVVTPPVQGGHNGGVCVYAPGFPAAVGITSTVCAGAGGGGAGTKGNDCGSTTNGAGAGKGIHVVLGSIDSWFGCGGGGAGASAGGNGRKISVGDATTGQGGTGSSVASGYTTPGLDGYGDGGGAGTASSHGRGGAGCIHVLEHIADTRNLVSFANDNVDKTSDKAIAYTPSEGCTLIDVLVVGGGGAGGFFAMSSQAVTAWGAKYCGGGGAGGGVLLILGMSVTNNAITAGWTTPVEISIDTTDGTTAEGPFSVGGTITSTFAEPEQLTLVLFRKLGITRDSDGIEREGFGGLPAAIQTVLSDAGSFTIRGIEPGYYVLLATVSGAGWQDGFWYADAAGRPKTIHVTQSITDADLVVG